MLDVKDCLLVVVDIQGKLVCRMDQEADLIRRAQIMVRAAGLLDLPVMVTEQYPQGLGETVQPIRQALGEESMIYEKRDFSIYKPMEIRRALEASGAKTIILMGVESHICIFQSTLDLLEAGYDCILLKDACASQKLIDHETAFLSMYKAGARLRTVQSLVFELMGSADHPAFPQVSKLFKEL